LTIYHLLLMLFDEALQYLLSLGHETLAIKLGLKNIERLLSALDSPQTSFRSVQIAGTNGKGSTAIMLDAIARAAGIKTGLYTSPHLSHITERIKIDGQEIEREDFARHATHVRSVAESLCRAGELPTPPTFFEQVTAIALLAFKEAVVELAILETGLGGRLDATTAAQAEVVAVTPIAIDHQEYLGQTLAKIAFEKAAIIRAGVEAVIAPQEPEARAVIEKRCLEVNVTPHFVGGEIEIKGADETGKFSVSFETEAERYEDLLLGLRGRHQAVNAAVAVGVAECLRARGFSISQEAIREGLRSAEHAGRLELWGGRPSILFDGAHNVASAAALAGYLNEFVKAPITLVFGAMRDKELQEIAALLFPQASQLILTGMNNPRAASIEVLTEIVPHAFDSARIKTATSASDAARLAVEITPRDALIVITGSLYLVGEMRELLSKEEA
jgi:dihydrofolate synthase/folylpolyglutamate synthase